jgi:hypothetical protein
MQCEVVMITGGKRCTIAGEPGARVTADGQSCALYRGWALFSDRLFAIVVNLGDRCHS